MRAFVVNTIVTAIALAITIWLLPSMTISGDNRYLGIVIVAAVFGVVNGFIKPVVKLLSLPVTMLTLGLFSLVINGFMLLLTAAISSNFGATLKIDTFPPDFSLAALGWAIVAAVILTIVRSVVDLVVPDGRR